MKLPADPSPAAVEAWVADRLAQMTLTEKINCLTGDTALLAMFIDMFVIGHYNRRPYPTRGAPRLGVPALRFSDGPRGVVMGRSTCFPVSMARGASFDRALEERIGEAIGRELRAQGANFYGGVCINLLRHPGWGRAQETYGEDPCLLGEMGAALVRGVQRHNVIACVKHFAVNSLENTRFTVNVTLAARTLHEVYLPHFKRCVEAGAGAVMGAYNRVLGVHCCESPLLLNTILREAWGFTGLTLSDFVYGIHDTVQAITAGMDVEMPAPKHYGPQLARAVAQGRVSAATVDAAARRVVGTLARFAAAPDPEAYPPEVVACPAHVQLAQEAAEASMVLLQNNGALPFEAASLRTLAVIGPLATAPNLGDHGSSRVHPPRVITLLAGLAERLPGVQIRHLDGRDLAAAQQAARAADAVVMVAGCGPEDEGENLGFGRKVGGDRRSLRLPAEAEALLNAVAPLNPRTAVVVIGGSAFVMEAWRAQAPAIVLAFYPGMAGGRALARVLCGDVNPSGRLPFTIARDEADYPFFDPDAVEITYGYYHGYTKLEKEGRTPAFAFGDGLSYTTFAVEAAAAAPAGAEAHFSVTVTNTGARPGATVVQLYVGAEGSAVDRPAKVLRDFQKVWLAPGEARRVTLVARRADLAYYDEAHHRWVEEDLTYLAHIGLSSRPADLLTTPFRF